MVVHRSRIKQRIIYVFGGRKRKAGKLLWKLFDIKDI
jgi:IS1 family transposase